MYKIGTNPCPKCREKGRDRAGDNLVYYGQGKGSYCWSCGYTELSDEQKAARGIDNLEKVFEEVMTKEKITKEEIEKIKSYTGIKGHNLRGITDDTYKVYAVRHKYDEETGKPSEQFYPMMEEGELTGFKIRILPKDFTSVGKFGKDSELFGQWKFKNSRGKYVVITAGEVDCMSAYQMLEDYRKSRNSDFEPIPVVSSVIGESGSNKQIQKYYEWFDRFERIIVCYDMDEPGKEAAQKLIKVLPKGKMYLMELPLKDINEMLVQGKEKQFIDAFFKAKPATPDGIIASGSLMSKIIEEALTPKIPLPPFMHELQSMMAGGIPLGVIVNLASASGTGKSTIADEMTYYWIFNSPYMIGVVSLESDSGQYGTKILSRHLGKKIDLIEDVQEKIDFLQHPDTQLQADKLWLKEDGSPRWYLVDDRDGGIESLKSLIMNLIIACGCLVIILDPLQDLLDGLSNEEQAIFMKWMKGMVKSHKVTFVNINHVRKSGGNQKANSTGADMHEEDIAGSSTILKSGACNLIFSRNKEAEDEIERNTTYMKAPKIRWTGKTGLAGTYYYDNKTATMYDKADYFQMHGGEF